MTLTIKSITYEEARLEYFREQKAKAERSLQYWANRAVKDPCYISGTHAKACDAADRISFYTDVIKKLEDDGK